MTASTGDHAATDFVVIEVKTACSRISSICQLGIVDVQDMREVFAWETLLNSCDEFYAGIVQIDGITAHHVAGQPTFAADDEITRFVNCHLDCVP